MRNPDTRDRIAISHTLSNTISWHLSCLATVIRPEKSNGKGECINNCNGDNSSKDIEVLHDSFLAPQIANLLAPLCASCPFTPIETTASTPSSGSAHRRHHHRAHHYPEREERLACPSIPMTITQGKVNAKRDPPPSRQSLFRRGRRDDLSLTLSLLAPTGTAVADEGKRAVCFKVDLSVPNLKTLIE